jgi:TetR/AcrR family transcriptional regulator, tetracycline repressor protein
MPPRSRRAVDFAAVWSEPPPKRPVVTRDQVVREALALLDEVGFDGLTMRRLAERLGRQAASLYNHVRDKHELLTLLADAITGEMTSPDPKKPWRDQLEASAREYRRVLLAHRDAARVLVVTPPVGPKRMLSIERMLAILRSAGFGDQDVGYTSWVFNTFVTGFVLDETRAFPSGDLLDLPAHDMAAQVEQWFKSLPRDQYPTVVALAHELTSGDMGERFEFGLQLMLDGLEHRRRFSASHR